MLRFLLPPVDPGPVTVKTVSRRGIIGLTLDSARLDQTTNYFINCHIYLSSAYLLEDPKLFGKEWKLISNHFFFSFPTKTCSMQ